ncbi:MAG: amidohydrolase family protein [Pseudomonadota bacterium]|jgi:predicted TIM-barrel fold metal-dependent hydrolase
MTQNTCRTIDVDRHVLEPIEMWPDYLDKRFHAHLPRLTPREDASRTWEDRFASLGEHALSHTPPAMTVDGRPIIDIPELAAIIAMEQASHRLSAVTPTLTGEHHLLAMDAGHIDIGVILPSYALYLAYNDHFDAALTRAFAQAYNRWILDYCAVSPRRMRPAALIQRQDPGLMKEDLEAALRQGFRSVVLRPNPVWGRTISDPGLLPFFDACAEESVPVLFHEGSHGQVTSAGADRYRTRFGQHSCSHPMEAMMALLSLIEGGVLERFPKLRVAFLEAGCSWLPHWLWRLDHLAYQHMRAEVAGRVTKPPSLYVKAQCWFSFECDEYLLSETFEAVGHDRFILGSDYPHVDHALNALDGLARHLGGLSPQQRRGILWDNPAALLGIPMDDLDT